VATINVSNSTALQSALRSANAGDEIRLAGGEYNLSMQNLSFSGGVTITSASASNAAVFSNINLTRASNLTFDGVELKADAGAGKPFVIRESSNVTIRDSLVDGATEGGYGDGHGLWIAYTDGFTLENTDVRDFNVAGYFLGSDDLAIRNNSFDNIAMDTLILGRVHGVQIANNVIDMNVKGGTKHTDAIQFWNTDDNDPSSNVTVSGNTIRTNNEASHGIYAANGLTQAGGGADTHFSNFAIRDNVVISAQMSAIAIGHANGVDITGNTVLQDTQFRSSSEIRTPIISVMADSNDVTITGNTTHKTPWATGANWQEVNSGIPGGWNVANNKIVPIGTTAQNAPSVPGTPDDDDEPSPGPSPTPTPDDGGDGRARTYRFDGDQVDRTPDTLSGFDFGEGDRIVLIDYARGTFKGKAGGNKLDVSGDGTYARINSDADIRELDSASTAVRVLEGQDDALVIRITQRGEPEHVLQIAGYADDYFG
jgi:hypothetical protein